MPDPETRDRRHDGPEIYPAEKARQAEIVLDTRRRRAIFLGGLAGFVLLAVLVPLFVYA
ncbi:hypothetical protein [Parvibaculum sp.]|jgi:hypothetical protein|uniref:hypothetical protein n=1 Tax=Parvibaculum sp. TaxID=2024848 RepID=UPI002FD9AF31